MNIYKLKHYALGLLLPMVLACSLGAANAQRDGEPYVHEEVFVEVMKPISERGMAGRIRVRLPSDKSCRACGEDLEIDKKTKFRLRPSGEVVDITMLSQYLPASGQVDVSRPGYAVLIQLDTAQTQLDN
ncbi:MAG: hypothetical protein ACI9WC_002780 [Arenicella sp.]|jgi:hypothetical protein